MIFVKKGFSRNQHFRTFSTIFIFEINQRMKLKQKLKTIYISIDKFRLRTVTSRGVIWHDNYNKILETRNSF